MIVGQCISGHPVHNNYTNTAVEVCAEMIVMRNDCWSLVNAFQVTQSITITPEVWSFGAKRKLPLRETAVPAMFMLHYVAHLESVASEINNFAKHMRAENNLYSIPLQSN